MACELNLDLRNLSSLTILQIGANGFNGSFPGKVQLPSSLTEIFASWNLFDQLELEKLSALPNLQLFSLNEMSASGYFPPDLLGKLVYLREFYVSSNRLTGGFPHPSPSITFELFDNQLSGEIDPSWTTNSNQVYLKHNLFNGSVAFLCSLNNALDIQIQGNKFDGALPNCFAKIPNLVSFVVSSNFLSGPLPLSLVLSSNLSVLFVDRNNFTGSVSNFELPKLGRIDLSLNRFEGTLNLSLSISLINLVASQCKLDNGDWVFVLFCFTKSSLCSNSWEHHKHDSSARFVAQLSSVFPRFIPGSEYLFPIIRKQSVR